MKSTELRIGNLVYDDRMIITKVFSLDEDEINHDDLTHNYSGIPLAAAWMHKFGFEIDGVLFYKYFDPRMKIRFFNGNSDECDICQDDKFISFKWGHIKYVHQLQNLFFALSGQELTIKMI